MTKAKVDVEIEEGVHITITAEGSSKKEALERAYKRSVAILKFVEAIESEAEVVTFEVEAEEPKPIPVWEAVNRGE